MNKLIYPVSLLAIIFSALFIMSCGQIDPVIESPIQINTIEELNKIITNCNGSEITSKEDIENNLIGDWQLIGISTGWVHQFEKSNISLRIDENSIVFNDVDRGEVIESNWNLIFVEVNSIQYYYLETSEESLRYILGMQTFCDQFMYGNGRVSDGATYVYHKVK